MDIRDIALTVIYKEHGWAVADQFEMTWDDQSVNSFSEQNLNALEYIYTTISELAHSDALTEDAIEELEEYLESMDEAMEYLDKD